MSRFRRAASTRCTRGMWWSSGRSNASSVFKISRQVTVGEQPLNNRYLGATPAVEAAPERGERFWVERPEDLAKATERLAAAPVVAIDAEFAQGRPTDPEPG